MEINQATQTNTETVLYIQLPQSCDRDARGFLWLIKTDAHEQRREKRGTRRQRLKWHSEEERPQSTVWEAHYGCHLDRLLVDWKTSSSHVLQDRETVFKHASLLVFISLLLLQEFLLGILFVIASFLPSFFRSFQFCITFLIFFKESKEVTNTCTFIPALYLKFIFLVTNCLMSDHI